MTAAGSDGSAAGGPERRVRLWIVLLPLIVFFGLAVVFLMQLLSGQDPSKIPSALIGKPAPSIALPALQGLTRDGAAVPGLDPADFRGSVTIVNVFASWCVPCRVEHPLLMQLAGEPGIRMVGIDYKDEPANALRFLGAFGLPYDAVGVDGDGRAAIEWGVYGVPETFIVGPDATIRYKFVGPLTEEALSGPLGEALDAARADAH